MKTLNPHIIKLIKQINSSENPQTILETIQFILQTGSVSSPDLAEIIKLLVNYKYIDAAIYIINNQDKSLLTGLDSDAFYLLQYLIEQESIAVSELLMDKIIQWNIQENLKKTKGIILTTAAAYNNYSIFSKLLNHNKRAFKTHLYYNLQLIKNVQIWKLCEEMIDLGSLSLSYLNDEIVNYIMFERIQKNSSAPDPDFQTLVKRQLPQFLLKNLIKSTNTLIENGQIEPEFLENLIRNNKFCLIRSIEMYACINRFCPRINQKFIQTEYLEHMCKILPANNCDLENIYGICTIQQNRDYVKEVLFSESKSILKLLESMAVSDLPENLDQLPHYKFLALAAAYHGYSRLINIFFSQIAIGNLPEAIINDSFELVFKHQNPALITPFIQNLTLKNACLRQFIADCVQFSYTPWIPVIIQCHGKDILQNLNLCSKIRKTHSPAIAKAFMEAGMEFDQASKIRLANLDYIKNINFTTPLDAGTIQENIEIKTSKFYGKGITQQVFKTCCKEMVAMVCLAFKTGDFTVSLTNIKSNQFSLFSSTPGNTCSLELLGKWRNFMAKIMGSENADKFGKTRTRARTMITPQKQRYNSYFIEYLNKLIPENYQGENLSYQYYIIQDGELAIRTGLHEKIGTESIDLTRTGLAEYPVWVHTDAENIEKILHYVQRLIKEAIVYQNPTLSKELIVQKIATIHWWLAQATPFWRGSAAVTEIIITALFQHHGFGVQWTKLPDCMALIEPSVEKFSENYLKFCQIVPTLKPVSEENVFSCDVNTQMPDLQGFTPVL